MGMMLKWNAILGVPELALQTQQTLAGRLLLVCHVQNNLTAILHLLLVQNALKY